jgi:hypothetical protein
MTRVLPSALPVTTTASMQHPTSPLIANESLFILIAKLLNGTELYKHQVADLIEPEKYSVNGIHAIVWTFTILTYLLAIPIVLRMFLSRAYLNTIDYFSSQIILCAFIAWIPSLILLLHHWFEIFTLRLCRFHYVVLSTNETVGGTSLVSRPRHSQSSLSFQVPTFFVLYMIVERFLYAHPSYKQRFSRLSSMTPIHLCTLLTWLGAMLIYTVASPFYSRHAKLPYSASTSKYCFYNYSKLHLLATARSIIYFVLFLPALALVGLVLRYFVLMRGTNQIPPIQKLWTIRATALLCILVFYDVYLYYLEHIAESYKSFLLASLLRASFYLTQLFIIACTEPYWLELLLERCACLCYLITGQQQQQQQRRRRRRATTTTTTTTTGLGTTTITTSNSRLKPLETEFDSIPYASSIGHYSLVDDSIDDEFDRAISGPPPTLRVIP